MGLPLQFVLLPSALLRPQNSTKYQKCSEWLIIAPQNCSDLQTLPKLNKIAQIANIAEITKKKHTKFTKFQICQVLQNFQDVQDCQDVKEYQKNRIFPNLYVFIFFSSFKKQMFLFFPFFRISQKKII